MKIKQLLGFLILTITCLVVLAGCGDKKSYEVSSGDTIKATYSFHFETYEKDKLIFADDGYIYSSRVNGSVVDKPVKTNKKWKKHGDVITAYDRTDASGIDIVCYNEIYYLYDNGKYLIYENRANNAFPISTYIAE